MLRSELPGHHGAPVVADHVEGTCAADRQRVADEMAGSLATGVISHR